MDIDAYKKEVDALQATHNNLKVLVPKLEEEIRGLKETIGDLHQDIVNCEVALDNDRHTLKAEKEQHDSAIFEAQTKLANDTQVFEALVSEKEGALDQRSSRLEAHKQELLAKQTELESLLQQQVAGEERLEKEMAGYAEKLGVLARERSEIEAIRTANEAKTKELAELEASLTQIKNDTDRDRQKAVDVLAEAQAKLKQANLTAKEVKDREALLSLRADEYERKEVLLVGKQKQLREKEIALNDRAAIYESQGK